VLDNVAENVQNADEVLEEQVAWSMHQRELPLLIQAS
jgi:hypothetical protein